MRVQDNYHMTGLRIFRVRGLRTLVLFFLVISLFIGSFVFSGCKTDESAEETSASTAEYILGEESDFQVSEVIIHEVGPEENLIVLGMSKCGDAVAVCYVVNSKPTNDDETGDFIFKRYLSFFGDQGEKISTLELDPIILEKELIDVSSDISGNACILVRGNDFCEIITISIEDHKVQKSITLKPEETLTMSSFEFDGSGNIYASGYGGASAINRIVVFDQTGKQLFLIEDGSLFGGVIRHGDKVYANITDPHSKPGDFRVLIYEIDIKEGTLTRPIQMDTDYIEGGIEGIYANSPNGVKCLNIETLTTSDVFLWSDINADKKLYGYGSILVLSSDVIFCLSNRNPEDTTNDSIIVLRRVEDSGETEKRIITVVGVWEEGYEPEALSDAVLEFNLKNEDYRIVCTGYGDLESLHMEMLGGFVPDIVVAQQSESLSIFESSGLLQDLNLIIDKDSTFDSSNYFDSVLRLSERNGKLFAFPTSFFIIGLGGLTADIGDRSGWTVQESNQIFNSKENRDIFRQSLSMSILLDQTVRNSFSTFVDYEKNTCSFNSANFCELLQWSKCNGIPDDSDQVLINDGSLLRQEDISDSLDYANFIANSSGPISFVGYPSPQRNSAMCFLFLQLGITSESTNASVCWEFIKMFISEDVQRKITENIGFPVNRTIFEEQLFEAMNPELTESESEVEIVPLDESSAQSLRELIDGLNTAYTFDESIMAIVMEEAPAYFLDQKSAEDVAEIIQSRVQLIINERS
jgi:ABC-type glycerol-3-phosphate transport system substrate-binding protein